MEIKADFCQTSKFSPWFGGLLQVSEQQLKDAVFNAMESNKLETDKFHWNTEGKEFPSICI